MFLLLPNIISSYQTTSHSSWCLSTPATKNQNFIFIHVLMAPNECLKFINQRKEQHKGNFKFYKPCTQPIYIKNRRMDSSPYAHLLAIIKFINHNGKCSLLINGIVTTIHASFKYARRCTLKTTKMKQTSVSQSFSTTHTIFFNHYQQKI